MTVVKRLTNRRRADLDVALHSLEGILAGIVVDQGINDRELDYLRDWLMAHEYLLAVEPMADISRQLQEAIEHRVVSTDGHRDLVWLIAKWSTPNLFYDTVTSDMQRLHRLMAGVAADDVITDDELKGMDLWLQGHLDLHGHWPYDDVAALIKEVLADGILHPEKREAALRFLKDFGGEVNAKPVNHDSHKEQRSPWMRSSNPAMTTLSEVCTKEPDVRFQGRSFCFTGKARSGPRAGLETVVKMRGGQIREVCFDLHYLVIGACSSPCWTYATYGRKIEQVMHHRDKGGTTLIIHEDDYVKAVDAP